MVYTTDGKNLLVELGTFAFILLLNFNSKIDYKICWHSNIGILPVKF